MFEIKQVSDKPTLIKPLQTQPSRFDLLITRLGGIGALVGMILSLGYLIVPLAFSSDGRCTYQGDIEIHPPFKPVFEENCLVMGPPISRIATKNLEGYGNKTIQYFEGALLMSEPIGNAQEVEIFPLGALLKPDKQALDVVPDTARFYEFLAETGNDQFLGQPVTDFLQMGDRLVIYYQNTSLRWNPANQIVSHQSLGRNHLLNHYPELLVEGENTTLFIPQTRTRFSLRNVLPQPTQVDDYAVNIAVKYPVLYSDKQQVVTVEVINRLSNEPVSGLTIIGLAGFTDLSDSVFDENSKKINFEPATTPGTYVATVTLPKHPEGTAGREVIIDVSFDGANIGKVPAVKKFQTWW